MEQETTKKVLIELPTSDLKILGIAGAHEEKSRKKFIESKLSEIAQKLRKDLKVQ